MSQSSLIELRDVSKSYRIYNRRTDFAKELLSGRTYGDDFWALRDISLTIPAQQRLGIIGANGSGKSTLLRIITGGLLPTNGEVRVHGKLSSVLSLNSVLNQDESAYENIRFNLLLQGCPWNQVDDKIEDILDFAELGLFAYKPIKTFSTGMSARLMFGIATSLDPDILILDEVLAVGDAYFTNKAIKRMAQMCEKGRGLLLVSHSTADIRRLCDTVLWLEHGMVRAHGPAKDVVIRYEEETRRYQDAQIRSGARRAPSDAPTIHAAELNEGINRLRLLSPGEAAHVTEIFYIRNITFTAPQQKPAAIKLGTDEPGPSTSWAWIDPIGCEWGRIHQRQGMPCRLLYPQSGRIPGGSLLVRKPGTRTEAQPVEISVEYRGEDEKSQLILQHFDVESCDWRALELQSHAPLPHGWKQVTWKTVLPALDVGVIETFTARLKAKIRPDLEIDQVTLVTDGIDRRVLIEGDPFEFIVDVTAHRNIPLADISVKISRDDGLYLFWQSSGQVGQQLRDFQGSARVRFRFDTNFLGAGNYQVDVACGDGWDLDNNYPYAKVYARRLNAIQFAVERRDARLDLGQLNVSIPVAIEYPQTSAQVA